MIVPLIDGLTWLLIAVGTVVVLTGGIGVLRLPDVYTRMHAASLTDTMGAGLFVLAMMLQSPDWLVVVKLFLIALFLFFTSPTSSFALAHAALTSGVAPVLAQGGGDGNGQPRETQP